MSVKQASSRVETGGRLTNFSITKVHDGEPVKLPTMAYSAKVEHHSVEFTVRRRVVPYDMPPVSTYTIY
jgi:hypothetical protein